MCAHQDLASVRDHNTPSSKTPATEPNQCHGKSTSDGDSGMSESASRRTGTPGSIAATPHRSGAFATPLRQPLKSPGFSLTPSQLAASVKNGTNSPFSSSPTGDVHMVEVENRFKEPGPARARKHFMKDDVKDNSRHHCRHCSEYIGFRAKHLQCQQCLQRYHDGCGPSVPHDCRPPSFQSKAGAERKAPPLGSNLQVPLCIHFFCSTFLPLSVFFLDLHAIA